MLKRNYWLSIVCACTLLFVSRGVAVSGAASGASSVKQTLRNRCFAAIEASTVPAKRNTLKETLGMDLGSGRFMFQWDQPEGGQFTCQICDDSNPELDCKDMGLRLAYRPKGGEVKDLPAELDLKCEYFLQKEIHGGTPDVDHDIVKRIKITPDHSEKSWLYHMSVDNTEYRCVIRKSDGNFRVEEKKGDDWRPIAAGMLF